MNDKSMVSFYQNVFDKKGTPVSASSILADIRDGKWAKQITILRMMQDEKAQKAFKNTLPCYTPSGLFSERDAESQKSHSGVLLLDFDAKDNPCLVEKFNEIRDKLIADQFTHFLFTSCRGNGIALAVKIDPAKHLESFLFLEGYYKEKYELVVDKGCKDVCRLRFISYDPGVYFNENAGVVVPLSAEAKQHAETPAIRTGNISNTHVMDTIIASGKLIGDDTYEEWIKKGFALVTEFGESGRQYFHALSRVSPKYDPADCDRKYDNCLRTNRGEVNFASIIRLAKKAGVMLNGKKTPARLPKVVPGVFEEITADDVKQDKPDNKKQKYANTDMGSAERFAVQHGEKIRFPHAWKKWLIYNSKRWKKDNSEKIMQYAKATAKSIFREAANSDDTDVQKAIVKFALKMQSKERLLAMVELAKSEPGIPISPDELDTDHYLLNCLNGTLDLRTGELKPHDPKDFITKIIPVKYDPGATCPAWMDFLEIIFNWNYDLINFAQRAVGYSLTGDTSEQCIFIPYGEGENGKSTFIDTVSMLLGEYAQAANVETFMVKKNDGGTLNDIARMKGARFISAVETEDGKRLSEVLIKQLTGGDTLSARFLHGEWFDFKPEAKIWLACNHKPAIRGTDHAIWRRIKLIPFTVKISPEKKLPKEKVMATFKKELPGILTWAVQGCLEWQKNGLQTPDEVQAATGKYRDEMDTVGQFLDDACILTPEVKAKASDLYDAYKTWCDTNGEFTLTQRNFGSRLTQKGLERVKSNGNFWKGVGIKN
jgi:putative DNA primase/helicase